MTRGIPTIEHCFHGAYTVAEESKVRLVATIVICQVVGPVRTNVKSVAHWPKPMSR